MKKNLEKISRNISMHLPIWFRNFMADELVKFAILMRTPLATKLRDNNDCNKEINKYKLRIEQYLVSTFPNIEVALRIYLCLMVCNCSGERTFSQLEIMKNEQRSTMGQNRLNILSLMSIECNFVRKNEFHINCPRFRKKKISYGYFKMTSGMILLLSLEFHLCYNRHILILLK